MTYRDAHQELKQMLTSIYDTREASHIADWVLEDLTGLSRIDRIMHEAEFSDDQEEKYRTYFSRLEDATPIQYVTGYAWFMGKKFKVNEDVLIPRPETEELVEWVKASIDHASNPKIIDIGTGSGCIPITLKAALPNAELHAVDVSPGAIGVAKLNAHHHATEINFHRLDFLDESRWHELPLVDIIVSNPPYVPLIDKDSMDKHVLAHEPHLAIFVPDDDPLIFYRAIVQFAEKKLKPGGSIFLETHHQLAEKVTHLSGGRSEIKKDLSGKNRMVKLTL